MTITTSRSQVIADIRTVLDRMIGREIWLDRGDECVIFTVTDQVFAEGSQVADFVMFCLNNYYGEFTIEEESFLEERVNVLEYIDGQ